MKNFCIDFENWHRPNTKVHRKFEHNLTKRTINKVSPFNFVSRYWAYVNGILKRRICYRSINRAVVYNADKHSSHFSYHGWRFRYLLKAAGSFRDIRCANLFPVYRLKWRHNAVRFYLLNCRRNKDDRKIYCITIRPRPRPRLNITDSMVVIHGSMVVYYSTGEQRDTQTNKPTNAG